MLGLGRVFSVIPVLGLGYPGVFRYSGASSGITENSNWISLSWVDIFGIFHVRGPWSGITTTRPEFKG